MACARGARMAAARCPRRRERIIGPSGALQFVVRRRADNRPAPRVQCPRASMGCPPWPGRC
eukprot:376896-Alexandrium_andersonii.AAC.1